MACFGHEGTKKGQFCSQHAEEGMVDVLHKRCSHDGCTKRPIFGHEGTKKAQFCSQHAEEGMMDVHNRRCSHDGCTKQPIFGHESTKKAQFCGQHAEEGMVDVHNKRCSHDDCTTKPSWGLVIDSEAIVCAQHKGDLEGEKVSFNTRCDVNGCNKLARRGQGAYQQSRRCHVHDPSPKNGNDNGLGGGLGKGATRRSTSRNKRRRRADDCDEVWDKRARKAVPRNGAKLLAADTAEGERSPASTEEDRPKKMLLVWV